MLELFFSSGFQALSNASGLRNSGCIAIGVELRALSWKPCSSRVLNLFKNGSTTDCLRFLVRAGLFCITSTLLDLSSQNLFFNHSQRVVGSGFDVVSASISSSVSLMQLSWTSSCIIVSSDISKIVINLALRCFIHLGFASRHVCLSYLSYSLNVLDA